jgi:outer membrane immunogenic protein
MLKRILLSTVALTMVAGSAAAADLSVRSRAPAPVYKAAPMEPVANWTGFYLGAHGGYGWSTLEADGFDSMDLDGALAGGQIGYDWQFSPNWVFGLGASGSWSDISGTQDYFGDDLNVKAKWLTTATARLGYTWGPGLIYVKGGAAWTKNDWSYNGDSGDQTRFGWTVGAGIEHQFAQNWTWFVEYNYLDFGSKDVDALPGVDIDQSINLVKAGINFRFGGSPVVARY